MQKIQKIIQLVISLPNTIKFNFHYFPITKAMKLPVLVSHTVKIKKMGNKGDIICPDNTGVVRIGFGNGSYEMGRGRQSCFAQDHGTKLVFDGKAEFANPVYITINHSGKVKFGNNFRANSNMILSCADTVEFKEDCLLSWNVTVIDGDGHSMFLKDSTDMYNVPKPIKVGEHVWISSNATLLKNCSVANGCVVSAGAIVGGQFDEEECILGGVPAKIIKRSVTWKDEWI